MRIVTLLSMQAIFLCCTMAAAWADPSGSRWTFTYDPDSGPPPVTNEISAHIDGYAAKLPGSGFVAVPDATRLFVGTFDFESLPGPLQPTRVDFTLEVTREAYPPDTAWRIHIWHNRPGIRLLTD
ncbi:MAG: hypothetical protein KKA42_10045 [candidate division Zixibacteria bacterium]|nr:hypothetical protein [candidate division Zixibacteria bacterium]